MTGGGDRLAIRSDLVAASALRFIGATNGITRAQQDAVRTFLLSGSGALHRGDDVGTKVSPWGHPKLAWVWVRTS